MPTVIKASAITTPDGVERELRFTLGTEKRIHDAFGKPTMQVFQENGDAALPAILWAMMHDPKGKPPQGYDSPDELAESMSPQDRIEYASAMLHAMANCNVEKKMIEDQLRRFMNQELSQRGLSTGQTSEPSPSSASESETMSSFGTSLPESSTASADGIPSLSAETTSEPELSPAL